MFPRGRVSGRKKHRRHNDTKPRLNSYELVYSDVLDANKPSQSSRTAHWRRITSDTRVARLLAFVRDLLLAQTSEEQRNPDLELLLTLRNCDRKCMGLLPRPIFEAALAKYGLLELLSKDEVDDICDAFVDENEGQVPT